MRRDAVLWNPTVLGEAAAQMPDAIKDAHPDVGWAQPTRLRNRIVHGYWDVDLQIVHDVASDDLPTLIGKLSNVLAELEERSRDEEEPDEEEPDDG